MKRYLAAAALGLCSLAQAATIYTDRAAFEAALTGVVSTQNYDCAGCSFNFLGAGAAAFGGVSYTASGSPASNNIFQIGSFYGATVNGSDFMQVENSAVTLGFGAGIRALGFDVDSIFSAYSYTLTVDGEQVSVAGLTDQHSFLGLIADDLFTVATLSSDTGFLQFDDMTTATDRLAVPAPGSAVLALPLLLALGLRRRRG